MLFRSNVRALRDQFITIELGRILYNGHFFTPEREFITSAIPASQRTVNGVVRLKLYKGSVVIEGRSSDEGLYDEKQSSMDELGGFEPTDTSGFIQIESIRIKKSVICSTAFCFRGAYTLLSPFARWAQANIRKGLTGFEPKDVHGTRV